MAGMNGLKPRTTGRRCDLHGLDCRADFPNRRPEGFQRDEIILLRHRPVIISLLSFKNAINEGK